MRLIDADALKEKFVDDDEALRWQYIWVVRKEIDDAPTIEERKGKWIDDGQYADYHSEHGFHCSVCGGCIIDYGCQVYDENPHCKWCGAKMEGAER